MEELRTVRRRFPDVQVLSITNETDETAVREFWIAYDGTWPVATDPDLATNERYGVTRIPTLLILEDGEEVWRHVGLSSTEAIVAALEAAGA